MQVSDDTGTEQAFLHAVWEKPWGRSPLLPTPAWDQ